MMDELSGLHYMKTIEVVAAIIIKDKEVFATQRGYGEFKGWWEFPGGKIEAGECYPDFHLTMHCFVCSLTSDSMRLNEHEAAAWLTKETLHSVKWLPADEGILVKVETLIS